MAKNRSAALRPRRRCRDQLRRCGRRESARPISSGGRGRRSDQDRGDVHRLPQPAARASRCRDKGRRQADAQRRSSSGGDAGGRAHWTGAGTAKILRRQLLMMKIQTWTVRAWTAETLTLGAGTDIISTAEMKVQTTTMQVQTAAAATILQTAVAAVAKMWAVPAANRSNPATAMSTAAAAAVAAAIGGGTAGPAARTPHCRRLLPGLSPAASWAPRRPPGRQAARLLGWCLLPRTLQTKATEIPLRRAQPAGPATAAALVVSQPGLGLSEQ